MNSDIKAGEHDLLSFISPDTLIGALTYLVIFVALALTLSRVVRSAVHAATTRSGHIDRTTLSFLRQMMGALIWVVMLILYAHLIPVLHSMGTALLAGASVASVIIGLAAQSTLGNLVAGVSITIYRPFRLGDTLQLEKAIAGCFLTKVDATAMTLELRLHASDSAHRDALRSKLIGELARRFAGAHLGAVGAEAATFA